MMCCVWTYDLIITLLNLACMYVCVHYLLSESYTIEASILLIEAVNSHFHLYGCDYHHNRIDGASWMQVLVMRRMTPLQTNWSTMTKACCLSRRGVRLG
jgi:hypothetical protein